MRIWRRLRPPRPADHACGPLVEGRQGRYALAAEAAGEAGVGRQVAAILRPMLMMSYCSFGTMPAMQTQARRERIGRRRPAAGGKKISPVRLAPEVR